MGTVSSAPESKTPHSQRVVRPTSWGNSAYFAHYSPLQFSFFCFCPKDICIKTESLLLSNSSAPAACVLFPIKILGFQPPHHFYKEFSELASSLLSPPLRNAGPHAPMHCSSFCFCLEVMQDCVTYNLSALIIKCSLMNRAPRPHPSSQIL